MARCPSTDDQIRQTLRAGLVDTLSDWSRAVGCRLTAVSFTEAVEVTLETGGAMFVLWLRPVSHEGQCYRRTTRFKIGYRGDLPGGLAFAAIDAACRTIEAWEHSVPDDAHLHLFDTPGPSAEPPSNLELLAVRRGLKLAYRDVLEPAAAAELVEQAHVWGLQARTIEASQYVSCFRAGVEKGRTVLVYVARTEEAVAVAAEAERAMVEARGDRDVSLLDRQRELGVALGYPPCCIEAFLPLGNCSNVEIRFHGLRQTSERASFLLNNFSPQGTLFSHFVCRYDCPLSLQYARAVLQMLAGPNLASALSQRERLLAGLVVMLRQEGALRLQLAGMPETNTYRFAGVEASGEGARFESWHSALRAADSLEVMGEEVRILRGRSEICRLSAPPDEVQIRCFA